MNEKTINEQYAYIRTLLEEKRLKEALMQLESLLWQCPDWDLRTRLEQLQTSYKYMLEYMRQGANDPERWNVYRKLIADTWEIADRSRLLMLDNASSRYYHEVRRTPRPESLSAYTLNMDQQCMDSRRGRGCTIHAYLRTSSGERPVPVYQCCHIKSDGML